MLTSGLDPSPVLTHRFAAEDYLKAFETMASGHSGTIVLDWACSPRSCRRAVRLPPALRLPRAVEAIDRIVGGREARRRAAIDCHHHLVVLEAPAQPHRWWSVRPDGECPRKRPG